MNIKKVPFAKFCTSSALSRSTQAVRRLQPLPARPVTPTFVGALCLTISLFFSGSVTAQTARTNTVNAASSFEVMVIHPSGQFNYHENDLDFGLQRSGIAFKHYTQDDSATILADLDRYSLVMCTPMVNLNNALAGGAEAVRAWIEKGNALVVTDACYPDQINPWLGTLVPEASLNDCACYGAETIKGQFVRDTDPAHPLRTFPERLDHESRQEFDRVLPEIATWGDKIDVMPIPHVLGYLGNTWGRGENPRFSDDFVTAYTAYVKGRGGVVTWDVPLSETGQIAAPFKRQLAQVRQFISKETHPA